MRIRFLLAVCACSLASAQFNDLATDRHGTRVLFSSSHSLFSEPRQDWQKLFEGSPSSLRTWLSLDPGYDLSEFIQKEPNYFRLQKPELSSDGSVTVYTGQRYCRGGSGCFQFEGYASTVRRDGVPDLLRLGIGRLSANGRWVLFSGWAQQMVRQGYIDLSTSKAYEIPQRSLPLAGVGRRVVANDGTAVFGSLEPGLHLMRPGEPVRVIEGPPAIAHAVIDDNARFAVYQAGGEWPWLGLVDLYTNENFLVAAAAEGCTSPALSEDGTTLLFLSGANWEARNDALQPQVWIMDLITGTLHQATAEPDGIAEATLSGDGITVFAATYRGTLLKVDLLSGQSSELISQTPWLFQPIVYTNPGATLHLDGAGLAGVQISLDGQEIPITAGAMRWVEFQVPPPTSAGSHVLELRKENSPFQPARISLDVELIPSAN
jgi:hypothetical protein